MIRSELHSVTTITDRMQQMQATPSPYRLSDSHLQPVITKLSSGSFLSVSNKMPAAVSGTTANTELPNTQHNVAVLCLKAPFRNWPGESEENTKPSVRRTVSDRSEV